MSERDEQEISQIVEAGFEAILSGKSSLEDELKKHPDMASVIRPELEAAVWLIARRAQVSTRPGFVASSRRRVVERVRQESAAHGKKHALFGIAWPQRFALQSVAALAIVLVLFLGAAGFFRVAANSVPGDTLYSAKRAQENVAYTLAFSTERQVELMIEFAERRLDEAEILIKRGSIVAAKAILAEFKADIEQAAVLIQQIGNDHPRQKKILAEAMQLSLSQQAERLEVLAASAPPDVQETIVEANEALVVSVAAAVTAGNEADQVISAGTSTGETSETPAETTTLTPSAEQAETQSDSPDTAVTSDPATTEVAPSGLTEPSVQESPTPSVKNSPKPTNVHRPTKKPTDSSDKTDDSSDTSDSGPPGLEKKEDE